MDDMNLKDKELDELTALLTENEGKIAGVILEAG
jgi:hypothetical protein